MENCKNSEQKKALEISECAIHVPTGRKCLVLGSKWEKGWDERLYEVNFKDEYFSREVWGDHLVREEQYEEESKCEFNPEYLVGDKVVLNTMNGPIKGTVYTWDSSFGKYHVSFDKGGSAWVKPNELSFLDDTFFGERLASLQKHHPHIDEEFKRLQGKMYQIFAKKMLDYGKDNISMGTALETDEEKKMALTATWTRMWDKMNRLKNLVVKGNEAQVNERIEDTYMDLANYALISLLVLNDDWK